MENWHWRNPLPQGNALNNVVFANGTWVALGDLGTLLTSMDGTNWVRRETGLLDQLRDCAYGGGTYVVVGDFGTVLTSTDGVSWTLQYPGTFYSLNAVTYAAGQFVAAGEQTTILTSPDGVTWTQRSSGDWLLFDITWAGGTFVAVGGQRSTSSTPAAGVILTSSDGRAWTRRLLDPSGPFLTVAYGNGQFAACTTPVYGNSVVWTSADGAAWSPLSNLPLNTEVSLFFGLGQWLVIPHSANSYWPVGRILVSNDLLTWTEVIRDIVPLSAIATGKGKLLGSRIDGAFLASTNDSNWGNPAPDPFGLGLLDLEYLNGNFVGVTSQGLVLSPDGSTWTNLVTVTNTGTLHSITYGNGRYVAGGESRTMWTSTDGITWTNPAPDLSIAPYVADVAVAFGNGVFVGAAGYAGDILTSTDGLTWMVQQLQTNANSYTYFNDVKFGNGRFVAVGQSAVATSTDGTNWNFNEAVSGLNAVACGKDRFVAVGYHSILTSTDGTNWTSQVSSQFGGLNWVAFGSGWFVVTATGASSSYSGPSRETPIWVSPDGLHWSSRHSHTSRSLNKVTFGNGTFVISGTPAILLQSDPLVNLDLSLQSPPQLLLSGPSHRAYRLEYRDGLDSSSPWLELGTVQAADMPTACTVPASTNQNARFYRAVLLP